LIRGLKRENQGWFANLIEKAYGHVNWEFLIYILKRIGFGDNCIGRMYWCISTSFAMLVNGSLMDCPGRVMKNICWSILPLSYYQSSLYMGFSLLLLLNKFSPWFFPVGIEEDFGMVIEGTWTIYPLICLCDFVYACMVRKRFSSKNAIKAMEILQKLFSTVCVGMHVKIFGYIVSGQIYLLANILLVMGTFPYVNKRLDHRLRLKRS